MTDKQLNITIRIADLPRIPLSIPASREELVRRAEENINILWNRWKEREEFKDKSSAEILAMVTFRFAQLYYANLDASENLMQTLADLEANFDRLLLRRPRDRHTLHGYHSRHSPDGPHHTTPHRWHHINPRIQGSTSPD